ncbi:nucleoside triphosphate pyrophosphohydrolase [Paenibacillus chartarius]|uniref:Nucleoside triphosphate pyrophosphohydrolase n=1 Tax=Paenibacillus chartarius TaxID=747481 RepID=A0ABV6DTX3_9BACL
MARITVLGLGTGDENKLTLGVWNKLRSGLPLYLRTDEHPMVDLLRRHDIAYESFDSIYVAETSFEAVYEHIAERLVALAKNTEDELLYAVPGHPMVAERTVQLLRERCPAAGVSLRVEGGESFLDEAFLRFGFDPIEGFRLLDATNMNARGLEPNVHTIVAQVYDELTASDVKLGLMDMLPDDYEVVVGHALGVEGQERIVKVPLYELDRVEGYGNLSLIWVPRSEREELRNRSFERLREIVEILRSPEGCPWDREQTHQSLRKHLIEETYEVLETIDDDDPDAMCEEMGDLLLQIMLHSQMEAEVGTFDVYDVVESISEKLIRRHPHVFGDTAVESVGEVLANWQDIKAEEKRSKGIDPAAQSLLAGVPRDLPGLMKAYKLQKKAAEVGFDWSDVRDVVAKIEEELGEVREVMTPEGTDEERIGELGDLIFAVVNLARFLKVDPEEALAATNRKFMERFAYIEEKLRLSGRNFAQTNLLEMENWWQEAKKNPRNPRG